MLVSAVHKTNSQPGTAAWPADIPNSLLRVTAQRNTYYAVRHAEAYSNCHGVLAGSLELDSTGRYCLTGMGRMQGQDAAEFLLERVNPKTTRAEDIVFYSSPFWRPSETGGIMTACFSTVYGRNFPVLPRDELRERGWGVYDGTPDSNWYAIRDADRRDIRCGLDGAESVKALFTRADALIAELERTHCGKTIILCTHCDPIQVMEALFARRWPAHYSDFTPTEHAEVRELKLGPPA